MDVLNVRKVAERRECARTLVTPSRHHVRRYAARTYGHTRVRVNGEKERGAGTGTGTEYRRSPPPPPPPPYGIRLPRRDGPDGSGLMLRDSARCMRQVCGVTAAREVSREFARTFDSRL